MIIRAVSDANLLVNHPPKRSAGVFSDIGQYLLRKPAVSTLLRFESEEERVEYSHRILQRIAVDVKDYAVLNVHRIGIECPVRSVFEELARWGPDSLWWPNHLSTARRVGGDIGRVKMMLFGRGSPSAGGLRLFDLAASKIVGPDTVELDSARYLLYECRGGYPIGLFVMFVRSPVAGLDETEQAQLFFAVSFDFYGKKHLPLFHPINSVWEAVHNRATSNILNRIKRLQESRFADGVRQ